MSIKTSKRKKIACFGFYAILFMLFILFVLFIFFVLFVLIKIIPNNLIYYTTLFARKCVKVVTLQNTKAF